MPDRVRMTSKTVFASDRITVFPEGGPPEGVAGGTVTDGQEFEADINLAKDYDRLGHAKAVNPADLEAETAPIEPHYSVSVGQMREQDPNWTPTVTPGTTFPSAGPFVPATDGRPADGSVELGAGQGGDAQDRPQETTGNEATDGPLEGGDAGGNDAAETNEEAAADANAEQPDAGVLTSTRRRNAASKKN